MKCYFIAYEDWKLGLDDKKIAEKYNVTASTVRRWKKQWERLEKEKLTSTEECAPKALKEESLSDIYEKLLSQYLSLEEQALLANYHFDEEEECIKLLRISDIQIIKLMGLIQEALPRTAEGEPIAAEKVVYELVLKYNGEIEKAKREKMRCIETLIKLGQEIVGRQKKETETEGIAEAGVQIYIPDNQRHNTEL